MGFWKSFNPSYHTRNTTPQNEVEEGEVTAKRQEAIILKHFIANPEQRYTPFEIKEAVGSTWEITSVRRAITNLTKAGHLVKDPLNRRPGKKGKSNCTWYYGR
jgi:hypothetical protein